jgi:hypothetical protein
VNLLSANNPSVQELQQLKSTLVSLQYPHTKRFAHDAIRGFGKDGTIAEFAKIWEQRWDNLLAIQGIDCEVLASFWLSSQGKIMMKEDEVKLLEWAESFKD